MAANPAQFDVQWEELAQGREITATVLMASGFVLPLGQRVRERYRLVGSLGKGGMGQVLSVALVGSPDQETFALKLVARGAGLRKDGTVDEADRVAAEQQAEMFAELLRQEAAKQDVVQRHGVSVARFFALVQLDDGSIGMRMETARGRSFEQRIADERARPAQAPDTQFAVLIIRKLMTQLRRLHELTAPGSPFGFIHSDIKPGNVFVDDRDRSEPHVTLLDFGVATAGQALAQGLASRGEGRKTLVLDQAGGTIGYAPPHHFTHKPTPLSDVFASIVMLYELLTGDLPWDFTGVPRTVPNLFKVEAILATPPRSILSVRPGIPSSEAAVLDGFFAREFASMVSLAAEASRTLETENPEPRRAMIERLSGLSRDYQARLEQLAQDLSSGSVRAITPPPATRDDARSARESSTMIATPRAAARAIASEPRVPVRRRGRVGWLIVLALIAAAAAASVHFGVTLHQIATRTRPVWNAAMALRDASSAPDPATVVPVDAATTSGVSIEALATAPVVAAPSGLPVPEARAVADEAGARAARPCGCVADEPGTVVVAQGGALENEVVLCATGGGSMDAGHDEYVGSGSIPAGVANAFPTLRCRSPSALLSLTVQRFTRDDGTSVPLFRCDRLALPDAGLPDAATALADAGPAVVVVGPVPVAPTTPRRIVPHPVTPVRPRVVHPARAPRRPVRHTAPHRTSHPTHPRHTTRRRH